MSVNPRVSLANLATLTYDESIDTPLSITNTNGTFYYHRDHQGSIVALTDESGNVVESFTYDNHYGKIIGHTKLIETNNPYAYTGRELDTEELYYYRARYYDPSLQRFSGEDPIGFEGEDFNFYRYVGSNPVKFVDPWGYARKGNKGDGSASGKNTSNPYKHCKQHPTKPNMLLCKDKRTGKKKEVPKPPNWDESNNKKMNSCETCDTAVKVVVIAGVTYFIYRCVRMIPSLAPPMWWSIPINAATP